MENKNKIEIPFGANDSELCECEYTIPEGYEAEIKDGKVIIRKVESEDEKIRMELIAHIIRLIECHDKPDVERDEKYESWIAWLEKQGEQKPAWSEEDEKYLKLAIENFQTLGNSFLTSWLKSLKDRVQLQNITYYNPYKEVVESIAEMCEKYKLPTSDLSDFFDNVKVKCKEAKEFDTMFPQNTWKPSEEQITWLYRVTDEVRKDSRMKQVLNGLLCDLKKLREE